jgi:AraC-like DNA-binding protein
VCKESAIALLAAGERPINEIAAVLGFAEPSAFHRAFRKWTGLTPGVWRKSADPSQPRV